MPELPDEADVLRDLQDGLKGSRLGLYRALADTDPIVRKSTIEDLSDADSIYIVVEYATDALAASNVANEVWSGRGSGVRQAIGSSGGGAIRPSPLVPFAQYSGWPTQMTPVRIDAGATKDYWIGLSGFGYESIHDPNSVGEEHDWSNYHNKRKDCPFGRYLTFRSQTDITASRRARVWDWTTRAYVANTPTQSSSGTQVWSDYTVHSASPYGDVGQPILVYTSGTGARDLYAWTPARGAIGIATPPTDGDHNSYNEFMLPPDATNYYGTAWGQSTGGTGNDGNDYYIRGYPADTVSTEVLDRTRASPDAAWDNSTHYDDSGTHLIVTKDRNSGGTDDTHIVTDENGVDIGTLCTNGSTTGFAHTNNDMRGILWGQYSDTRLQGYDISGSSVGNQTWSTNQPDYAPAELINFVDHQMFNDRGRGDPAPGGMCREWLLIAGRKCYGLYNLDEMVVNDQTASYYRLSPATGGPIFGTADQGSTYDSDTVPSRDCTKFMFLSTYDFDNAGTPRPIAYTMRHSGLTDIDDGAAIGAGNYFDATNGYIYIANGSASAFAGVNEIVVGAVAAGGIQVSCLQVTGTPKFTDDVTYDTIDYTAIDVGTTPTPDQNGWQAHVYSSNQGCTAVTDIYGWMTNVGVGLGTYSIADNGASLDYDHRKAAFWCTYVRIPDTPYLHQQSIPMAPVDLYQGYYHNETRRLILWSWNGTAWTEHGPIAEKHATTFAWETYADNASLENIADYQRTMIRIMAEEWSGFRSLASNGLVVGPMTSSVVVHDDRHAVQVAAGPNTPGVIPTQN